MKAFYFATPERKLRYGDGRSITIGQTHTVKGEIKLCKNGLHASQRLLDALYYAPGNTLYLVELEGDMDIDAGIVAARSRTYLAEYNAADVLMSFARKQALINIELIKPYTEQYDLIVDYLETGNEAIRQAARDAAYATRATAAWVAYYAARDASDVRDAAYAAYYAARAAARDGAWDGANEMLTTMIREATGWDI